MKNIHIVSALLLGTPFLQSCASGPIPAGSHNIGAGAVAARGSAESPAAYYQLGRYYQAQNRLDAAATAYEKALAADSNFYDARNGLGVILSARGKYDLAIEQFRAAIAQSPRSGHLHNNLAQAYYLQGRYQEAVTSFETAVTVDPRNYGALARLSQAYAKAGMPEQSQQALSRAHSFQAQSAVATQSFLGRPGTVVAEHSTSAANAAIESVASSILPTTHTPTVAIVSAPSQQATRPANSNATISRSEITGKLVPISTGVFELVVPGSVAARPSSVASSLPALTQPARLAVPAQVEPSRLLTITSAASTDVKITPVSPGVYELEAISPVVSPASAVAVAANYLTPATTPSLRRVRVEVSNGNGIRGLAKRVSTRLKQFEQYVARLTNQRPPQAETTIEYRDGYIAEAAHMAAGLQKPLALVPSANLRRDIHVRLVLGRDIRNEVALFQPISAPPHRAASTIENSRVAAPHGSAKAKPSSKSVNNSILEAGKRPAAGIPTPVNSSRLNTPLTSEQLAASR